MTTGSVDVQLDMADERRLVRRSEGWLVGLQLAALGDAVDQREDPLFSARPRNPRVE